MQTLAIAIFPNKIADFCQRWHVAELALFGSVLRDDFRPDSDVDVLVTFEPEKSPGLLGFVRMKSELGDLFGREVDLLTKKSIEASHNWIRRKNILGTAQVIFPMYRDEASLLDIVKAARNILEFAQGKGKDDLSADTQTQSAILYQIIVVGEATKRLSSSFRSQHPEVFWKDIAGMRDVVAHQYDRIDIEILWRVIQQDVPELLSSLEAMLLEE